ncbi:MAG: NAD(P)-binding domain-containing protein, partial [Nitrospirota bacterium]|nr:NAD(P)-binding domain-containing protein [Nitrospirota bacterium]
MNQDRRKFLVVAGVTIVAATLPLSARSEDAMKIGIIGSGKVGSALGTTWVKAGHEVMFSSRHIEYDQSLA